MHTIKTMCVITVRHVVIITPDVNTYRFARRDICLEVLVNGDEMYERKTKVKILFFEKTATHKKYSQKIRHVRAMKKTRSVPTLFRLISEQINRVSKSLPFVTFKTCTHNIIRFSQTFFFRLRFLQNINLSLHASREFLRNRLPTEQIRNHMRSVTNTKYKCIGHIRHIMTYRQVNPHYKKKISTSQKEITDLLKAWLVLGVAFAIVLNGLKFDFTFFIAFSLALLTLGAGFLFHEMAHKLIAQRYGCFAEFRSFDKMLFLALVFSIFGFIFAAPGAVMIRGRLTHKQNGLISAAGPAMNMILAGAFFALMWNFTGYAGMIGKYGFIINTWLALFNMIPVAMFDGKKIWNWNKPVYVTMVVIALGLIVVQNLVMMGRF